MAGTTTNYAPVPPSTRSSLPRVAAGIDQDRFVHDVLVAQAHQRLGNPGTAPRDFELEDARARLVREFPDSDAARSLAGRDAHMMPIELGTQVEHPKGIAAHHEWTVVGAGDADRVHLATRNEDGTVSRKVVRWPELIRRNPMLATRQPIPASLPGWPTYVVPDADHGYQLVATNGDGVVQEVARGSWDELLPSTGLTRLRPFPLSPGDASTGANLIDTSRRIQQRLVISNLGLDAIGRSAVVGVDEVPPGRPDVVRELEDLDDAFAHLERLGLQPRGPQREAYAAVTDSGAAIGNAFGGWAGRPIVTTGIADTVMEREVVQRHPYDLTSSASRSAATIRASRDFVFAHEIGHVVTKRLWGVGTNYEGAAASVAGVEHNVVEEAFSDLFGASHAQTRDGGVRDLGALRNGYGNLDQLRSDIAARVEMAAVTALPVDGHDGTQLITKPMLGIADAHGWTTMGEVTASAMNKLSVMLGRGEIDAIDIPTAARMLRDSAADRWGMDSPVVRGLTETWTKLRVLR